MKIKKISIITPCRNADQFIAETVESVIGQTAVVSGRTALEYIICDGGSTDRTVEIAQSLTSNSARIISEPDRGMYDALAKGLKLATGDICAYINAGDFYSKTAFDTVLDVFASGTIRWITGYNVVYNEKSQIMSMTLPYKYRRNLFACGFYGQRLEFVQQESTFWRSGLNTLVDLEKLSGFQFAGDSYLWHVFSRVEKLYIIQSYLGGFKRHSGQLSESKEKYFSELTSFAGKPSLVDYFQSAVDKILWYMPDKIKKAFNRKGIITYDSSEHRWA